MGKQHWQDWINGLLGLWIFGSPWLLVHSMVTEVPVAGGILGMWNLSVVGLAVVVICAIALYRFNTLAEWINLLSGAWLVVSPLALCFSASAALTWNSVVSGSLIVIFAGWCLYDARNSRL